MDREETADSLFLERLRSRDERAWARVMREYRSGILGACLRRIGNREDAEDICSEVFSRGVRGIEGFRGEASLKTWLHTIAAHLCWSHHTVRGRSNHMGLDQIPQREMEGGALNSEIPSPDRVAGSAEIRSALDHALATLDPVLREAFHLRVVEEMSYDDIARVTGVPMNTVKTRIFRARERLQKQLVEHR